MTFAISNRLLAAAGCAATLALGALPGAAKADIHWTVEGTFDDTGSLSGSFDIDQYGFLTDWNLVTTDGATMTGMLYTPATSYYNGDAFHLDLEPEYQNALYLVFLNDLTVPAPSDPLVAGATGASWECRGSWSCYLAEDGAVRYITLGAAHSSQVGTGGGGNTDHPSPGPEPAVWVSLLAGFGVMGSALRATRRRKALPA